MDNTSFDFNEKKACFDAFIEEYKEKNLKEKQTLIINDLKELVAALQQLCVLYNIKSDLLINKEIADVNSDPYSEDDFAEAVYVYLQMFKEILSDFMIDIIKDENMDEI